MINNPFLISIINLKKLKSNITITISAFFIVFFIFCAFAIDFAVVVLSRSELQQALETTALLSAPYSNMSTLAIESQANKFFSYIKTSQIKYAKINTITAKSTSKAILLEASMPVQPYFMSVLGINSIEVQARSAAAVIPITLTEDTTLTVQNHKQFNAPMFIFDKNGNEISIENLYSSSTNYRLFVGMENTTGDISWVEATCAAEGDLDTYKEYDLGNPCLNVSVAKYLRIVNNVSSPQLQPATILLNTAKLIKFTDFKSLA